MTLTEFLLARIAEDEAAAMSAHRESISPMPHGPGFIRSRIAWAAQARDVRGHELIERMTPARVLAQCEANRQIAEAAGGWLENDPNPPHWAVEVVRHLATVYADHPDYLEEWRV
ncbi:MAG: DUF6221 family protein [Mycobacteriaceae bacterium]